MELDLHLAVRLHEVRREALYISPIQIRCVEYPLSAHLVLDAQTHQQFIEAHGTESVVLRYLGDGDRLRAAQDVSGIVRERSLLPVDFFEQSISAFQYTVLLLQFVSSVLADGRKHFAGHPSFESLGTLQLRREDEGIQSAFVDEDSPLLSA